MSTEEIHKEAHLFNCTECGAELNYKPGTISLNCNYCGNKNEIPVSNESIEELDFEKFVASTISEEDTVSEHYVKCDSCGASSSFSSEITASNCPYCGTALVFSHSEDVNIIKPKALLPFKLDKNEGIESFRKWIKSLWFAPNAIKKAALSLNNFKGVYMPHWTYDFDTRTVYTGQRGTHYTVSESYTENGQTKTRQVQKTRWTTVSGEVSRFFDDIVISASNSLPRKYVEELEPWDLNNLVPYEKGYLSGFISEKYQIELPEGYQLAKEKADSMIRGLVRQDIGGDDQRIVHLQSSFSNTSFKHILLPVYISAYTFKSKLYQFVVNARTGEVQGERPWSWMKIGGLIAAGIVAFILIRWLMMK